MARTTTFWIHFTSMACNPRQIHKPQSSAQHQVVKVYAHRSVTTPANIARRGMSGASATCMAWASTWQTWHKSLIVMSPSHRRTDLGAKSIEWWFALYSENLSKWKVISNKDMPCMML